MKRKLELRVLFLTGWILTKNERSVGRGRLDYEADDRC